MNRCEREAVNVMAGVFDAAGLTWTTRRGKHLCVVVTGRDGSQHTIPVAGSPRADLAAQANWARQDAMRLVEKLGGETGRGLVRKVKPKSRRKANNDRLVLRFEERQPGRLDRDPWAVLEALKCSSSS